MVKYRSRTAGSVSSAGTLLATETPGVLGVVQARETELAGFTRRGAVHLPGKPICDLAVMLAAGGDIRANVVMLRARRHLLGQVASDPRISRIVHDIAWDVDVALAGIAAARASMRAAAGLLPGWAITVFGMHCRDQQPATSLLRH